MSKWLLAFLLLLSGCASPKQAPDGEDSSRHVPASTVSAADILAENLKIPWDITKSGGSFFISERKGMVVRINRDGEKKEMEVKLAQPVLREGEGGLLGFELHPNFSKNGLAYIYHTYLTEDRIANRIVQIQKQNETWQETKELLANIPGGSIHNGGRLAIGPDKKLYATAGDAGQKSSAQDQQTLSGKILRLNLDGSIPSDNPFENSYIFSYGHRNPQGMAWSEDGTMYATEHGQSAHDEVNKIESGKNYGWPVIEGDEKKEGMVTPLVHSGEETWAPSGLAYTDGKLFIAALRGEKLLAFDPKSKKMTVPFKGAGRLRDVYVRSGSLHVVTNNTDGRGTPAEQDDRLLRLSLP
ncbi:PQQ-dependent sugar dehydrogenase [Pseudobacillus wudalianchiensis]|uniref:Quinoprotein glucose dehydrogenase n=1 Tax=Pseudobacillus wudalianchiensis TaxID=1743143 RepID=A0A1B9B9M0_9BACI|nr:PQQ-dependent sugar dehydrogenase [Bacillus wudalianchiensis]OCA92773.1 quinoprotein glucose dehydrogenase [Bacillus wudalianchiensis]